MKEIKWYKGTETLPSRDETQDIVIFNRHDDLNTIFSEYYPNFVLNYTDLFKSHVVYCLLSDFHEYMQDVRIGL